MEGNILEYASYFNPMLLHVKTFKYLPVIIFVPKIKHKNGKVPVTKPRISYCRNKIAHVL